jgi:hypothetical protein
MQRNKRKQKIQWYIVCISLVIVSRGFIAITLELEWNNDPQMASPLSQSKSTTTHLNQQHGSVRFQGTEE